MTVNFNELKNRLDKCTDSLNFGYIGAMGHTLQWLIPIYGIVNDYKKNKALGKYVGKGNVGARTFINTISGIGNGLTGDEFENLIEAVTNQYIEQKKPNMDRKLVRKAIKKILYTGKDPTSMLDGVDLSKLKMMDLGKEYIQSY